jgi:CYTH domain-containing protein
MPVSRRFQIAPPLARLIQKSCVPARVTEGHFPRHSERQSLVRVDNRQASLILTTFDGNPEVAEETTFLPSVHAEALLKVCTGIVVIERSAVPLASVRALVDRFVAPGPLDLVSVEFATSTEAAGFQPPMWFGMEVSADDRFHNREIALFGLPPVQEAEVSNTALEAVLDFVDGAAAASAAAITLHHGLDTSDEGTTPAADNQPAEHAALPRASGLDVLHPANDRDARDEDMARLVENLAATLAQTARINGSSINGGGWLPGRQ